MNEEDVEDEEDEVESFEERFERTKGDIVRCLKFLTSDVEESKRLSSLKLNVQSIRQIYKHAMSWIEELEWEEYE